MALKNKSSADAACSRIASTEEIAGALSERFSRLRQSADPALMLQALKTINEARSAGAGRFNEAIWLLSRASTRRFRARFLSTVERIERETAPTTPLGAESRIAADNLRASAEYVRMRAASEKVYNSIFRPQKGGSVLGEQGIRAAIAESVEHGAVFQVTAIFVPPERETSSRMAATLQWLATALDEGNLRFGLKVYATGEAPQGHWARQAAMELESTAKELCDPRITFSCRPGKPEETVPGIIAENPGAVFLTNDNSENSKNYGGLMVSFVRERSAASASALREKMWAAVSIEMRHPAEQIRAMKKLVSLYNAYPEQFSSALRSLPPPKNMRIAKEFSEFVSARCPSRRAGQKKVFASALEALEREKPDPFQGKGISACLRESVSGLKGSEAESLVRSFTHSHQFHSTQEERSRMWSLALAQAKSAPRHSNARALSDSLEKAVRAAEKRIAAATASEVLEAATQSRYLKDKPLEPEAAQSALARRIEADLPLEFAMVWGGAKESQSGAADGHESAALRTLLSFVSDVSRTYSPSPDKHGERRNRVTLMLADSFAERVNGKSARQVENYAESMKRLVASLDTGGNIRLVPLSQAYAKWAREEGGFARFVRAWTSVRALADQDPEKFAKFAAMSKRHSRLVREGAMSPEENALIYLSVRAWESERISKSALQPVFLSHGSRETETAFSSSPTLFLDIGQRTAQPPWFHNQKNPQSKKGKEWAAPAQPTEAPSALMVEAASRLKSGKPASEEGIRLLASLAEAELANARDALKLASGVCAASDAEIRKAAHSAALFCLGGDAALPLLCGKLAREAGKRGGAIVTRPELEEMLEQICIASAQEMRSPASRAQASELALLYPDKRGVPPEDLALEATARARKAVMRSVSPAFAGARAPARKADVVSLLSAEAAKPPEPKPAREAITLAAGRDYLAELLVLFNISPRDAGFKNTAGKI